jgi:ribosomal-protein-alanine N-acetyltransferase
MTSATPYLAEGLATERIILRAAHEQHATELLNYYEVNRQHLQPWEPLRPERFSPIDSVSWPIKHQQETRFIC